MTNPYLRTTPEELSLFLDDVEKNVTLDENTDFKKLLLFLYGFTNAKFESLRSEKLRDESSQTLNLLLRLVDTIALVLSKKKHLLNAEITPAEISQVLNNTETVSVPFGNQNVYEWGVHFSMCWLLQFPYKLNVTNVVKLLLIGLINSVTVHVKGFRYARQVQIDLLKILSENVNYLFSRVKSVRSQMDKLTATVHLLSVVNDYDVQRKLMLTSNGTRLQLEGFIKRTCFILDAIDLAIEDSFLPLVDNLKSVLILGMTSNLLLDESMKWSQVAYLMSWIHSHLESFRYKSKVATQLKNFNKAVCSCLMKIYDFCQLRDLLNNFFTSFNTSVLEEKDSLNSVNELLASSRFPPSIKKLSHILWHQKHVYENTSVHPSTIMLASVPFLDNELDELRNKILGVKSGDITSALYFIIPPEASFTTYIQSISQEITPDINYWLAYV